MQNGQSNKQICNQAEENLRSTKWFQQQKKAYLDALAKDFMNCKDRGTFYDEVMQGLIDKFGYSHDGKVYVEADTLSPEEQMEYYQALRDVSIDFTNCIKVLTGVLETGTVVPTLIPGQVLRPHLCCRDC